ncbi:MAG: sugar ABC transporter substrate-binding protein [Chloroflexota bacterium]
MTRLSRPLGLMAAALLALSACGSSTATPAPSAAASATTPPAASASAAPSASAAASPTEAPSVDTTPVTLTVWDYYGKEVTPFTPDAIAAFQEEYPWITVDRQDLDWETFLQKFNTAVSSGQGPDVATLDMTWIPTLASNDVLADLKALSGGSVNGASFADTYAQGPLDAMTYGDKLITAMSDFDAYVLYYRSDLLDAAGVAVPKTWDELLAAAKAIAKDSNGDGKADKNAYAVRPNTFHFSQFLFQNGGSILNADNTKAAFNSPEGVAALDFTKSLLDNKAGLYWSDADGDLPPALADGRVAMFSDGPYYMGLMKSGVPDQSGKWKVAVAPYSKQPGSYLGGTGLSIPASAAHQAAAWKFIEYFLRPEQQARIFTVTGALPATTAALESKDLTQPDPYFGGQVPSEVFLDTLKTATHLPYVAAWSDIDTVINENLDAALLGKETSQAALDAAADDANAKLGK